MTVLDLHIPNTIKSLLVTYCNKMGNSENSLPSTTSLYQDVTGIKKLNLCSLTTKLRNLSKPILFGIHLGVPQTVLTEIENEHQNIQNQKIALFKYIEKERKHLRINWTKICECLELMDESVLAHEIKFECCEGTKDMPNGWTALMRASEEGSYEIVKALLDHRSEVNKQTEKGVSSLVIASLKGHKRILALLIEYGGNVNMKMKDGMTCLMIASDAGHTQIVELLLSKGADIDAQNDRGATALMIACKHGHLGSVKVLIKNDADVNLQDVNQDIAVNFAAEEGYSEVCNYISKKKYVKCCCCYCPTCSP